MERIQCSSDNHTKETEQVPGMAYVPKQIWRSLLPMEQGFYKGTIFEELNKPFQPKRR